MTLLITKVLVGAGGHASVIYDIAMGIGFNFDHFQDPLVDSFYSLKKIDHCINMQMFFLGIGGSDPMALAKRETLYQEILAMGLKSFVLKSAHSYVSSSAFVEEGTLIAHNAVVQAGARIGRNCIINTGAIIEHHALIEEGCHIAPGAIVLGGAKIGRCTMVGAGSVILPQHIVPSNTLVPSLTRYKS